MLVQDMSVATGAQKTVKTRIPCSGIGLHSGARVTLALNPAPVGHGIVFRRTDLPEGENLIPARHDRVSDTRLCTLVSNEHGASVGTIEHLMAALAAYGIDNLLIEIDGPEVPIMDGSAEPFIFLLDCAGVLAQEKPRRAIKILKTVTVTEGEKTASFGPADGTLFRCDIAFPSAAIGSQSALVELSASRFKHDFANCRTFGFLEEVEMLRKAGLARGGSLNNAVVLSGDTVLNPEGLRRPDEFARHKLLDAVGDLYLAGAPIIGAFHGVRTGHALNNKLLHAIFADQTAWCWIDYAEAETDCVSWAEAPVTVAA